MNRNVDDARKQRASHGLANFFLQKEIPHEAAESHQVKELLGLLKTRSQSSANVIGRKCLELYEKERAELRQTLWKLDGRVSLSVDILRSGKKHGRKSEYLCLTASFVDKNWELKRRVLSFSPIGDQVDDSPAAVIIRALEDWGIERKIGSITMVNHPLYDETVENVKNHVNRRNQLPLDGVLFGVRCCGDMVKLVVQEAYASISHSVERIGEIYSFKGVRFTWYDRLNKLKEFLIMQSAGRYSPYSYQSRSLPYSMCKQKRKRVSRVCELLGDVYDVVFPLFESGHSTSNIFLHYLQELQLHLMKLRTKAGMFAKDVIGTMLETFNKEMERMYLVLAMSSVLDPRFKMEYIEFSSCKLKGDEGNSLVNSVLDGITGLYESYAVHSCDEDLYHVGRTLTAEYKRFVSSKYQRGKLELDSYLQEPVVAWSPDFDLLSWWKHASAKYPTLSRMARDLFAIPATIALSSDEFYMKQRKADYSVIASAPEVMNAFVCVRNWLLHN